MPVRDVELFFPARELAPRVLSNRGANGIDGTVSSAFGATAASDGSVVLLVGDVALARDLGGLLAARRLGLGLTIVLLNNDGGGIFHFLPVAGEPDAFEEHIATPQGLQFARAAELYGCRYERPHSVDELRTAIEPSLRSDKTTIIEVRTDREANSPSTGAWRMSPSEPLVTLRGPPREHVVSERSAARLRRPSTSVEFLRITPPPS